jgi:hypothetical protein
MTHDPLYATRVGEVCCSFEINYRTDADAWVLRSHTITHVLGIDGPILAPKRDCDGEIGCACYR